MNRIVKKLNRVASGVASSWIRKMPGPVGGWLDERVGLALSPTQPPMHGQNARMEIVRQIIQRCHIERIVETGTYRGSTTRWLSAFGLPVVSAELVEAFARSAQRRLSDLPNVDIRHCSSVALLASLAGEFGGRAAPTFFYLDAHSRTSLPLREEIELVFGNFDRGVAMIDDFQVPDDPGYGFDQYGEDKRLTIEYIRRIAAPAFAVYFPTTRSDQDSGVRRGYAVIAADHDILTVLDATPLLRRWPDPASTDHPRQARRELD